MNLPTPGLRELSRAVGRQVHRLRLYLELRKLARLETSLGLLGWQQADYDAGTQEQVNRLMDVEREQGRLTNESAAIGLQIQEIEERRGVGEREFAEAEAAALEKEHPSARSFEALEGEAVAKRKERRAIEARLPVLDRELSEAEEHYRERVASETSPEKQAQLLRWRKVILALPRERAEWVVKLQQVETELAATDTLLNAMKEARARFEERDQEMADDIAAHQRAKRKVEKQIETVEKAKTDPYREIGRALADQNIGPLNQPEALAAVLEQRGRIARMEAAIAASLAESARDLGKKSV